MKLFMQELLDNTTDKQIIFAGKLGSGKTHALAAKALTVKSAIIFSSDIHSIRIDYFPIFARLLGGTVHNINLTRNIITTKNSRITLMAYDSTNLTNSLRGVKCDLICFDNISDFRLFKNRLFNEAAIRAEQVIIAIDPDCRVSYEAAKRIMKSAKIISAKTIDDNFINGMTYD